MVAAVSCFTAMFLSQRDGERNLNLFLFYRGYKSDLMPLFIWPLILFKRITTYVQQKNIQVNVNF